MRKRKLIFVAFEPDNTLRSLIEERLKPVADVVYPKDLHDSVLNDIEIVFADNGSELRGIIGKLKNVRFIQTIAAGVDTLPFDEIRDDILIASCSGCNALPAAEHAIALMLCAIKRIAFHDRYMRRGIWKRQALGSLLHGKVLGIIGYGNVGRQIGKLAKALGLRVKVINRTPISEKNVEYIGKLDMLDRLLAESDIVIIALPLTKETKHIIDKRKLEIMKKNAILINISRGPIIVEKDLYEHLRENPNFIAALDVWWTYPTRIKLYFEGSKCFQKYPFHTLENVIMTPHIAGFSKDYMKTWYNYAIDNILRYIRGEKPRNLVRREDYV